MKKQLGLILCLCLSGTAFAQQSPQGGTIWDLYDCIDYAMANNIQVKQSELEVVNADLNLNQAKWSLGPNISAGTGINYNVGRNINPVTNLFEEVPVTSQNINLSANQNLFSFFQQHHLIRQQKVNYKISQLNVDDVKNQVTLQIVNSYTQILLDNELLRTAEERFEVTQTQLSQTERLVQAGSQPLAQLLDIRAQTATDELEVINAENNLELSILSLKQILQIPARQEFDIEVPELPEPDTFQYNETAEEVFNVALQTQPNILSAEEQIRSAEYDIKVAKTNLYPSLFAQAGLFTNYSSIAPDMLPRPGGEVQERFAPIGFALIDGNEVPVISNTAQRVPVEFVTNTYQNQLDANLRRLVGVNLNIPIFSGMQNRRQVSRAVVGRDMARLNAVNEQLNLRQNIEQAYLDAKTASKRFRAAQQQVESLQEAFRATEQRFNLGAINSVEYNVSRNNLAQAESQMIQSKYDYLFKLKILDFYQGKPLSF